MSLSRFSGTAVNGLGDGARRHKLVCGASNAVPASDSKDSGIWIPASGLNHTSIIRSPLSGF
jgi:hypothetical protein